LTTLFASGMMREWKARWEIYD